MTSLNGINLVGETIGLVDTNPNTIIGRARCPSCASQGKDTSKDNLALYSDGHEHCFACTYHLPSPAENRIRKLTTIESKTAPGAICLPDDASTTLPVDVLSRLLSWDMTPEMIVRNRIQWSEKEQRLLLPVYDEYDQLLMYQARSWDIGQKKYLTFGKPRDILHIVSPVGTTDNTTIIICEDLISAIRIGEVENAIPLWGSDIPLELIRRLSSRFSVVGVWLDPDMKLKAVKDVLRISQYVPAFFIDSNLDPKFYNREKIKDHINISQYEMMFKDKPVKKDPMLSYPVFCSQNKSEVCEGHDGGICCQDDTKTKWKCSEAVEGKDPNLYCPSVYCACHRDSQGVLHQEARKEK